MGLPLSGIVYSQSSQLSIRTESSSYAAGDTIIILGSIPIEEEVTPAIVQIINSENETLAVFVPAPDNSGNYSFEVATDSWQTSGTYFVRIMHVDEDREVTFEFAGLDSRAPVENLSVSFSDGSSQSIDATMTNGIITSITAVEETTSLIFSVATTTESGEFSVVLPRTLIDSRDEPDEAGIEEENNFLVLVDGEYSDYAEAANTETDRTLIIPIPVGTEEVLIGGSSMVPEFPFAVMGVVVALAGMLALTRLRAN